MGLGTMEWQMMENPDDRPADDGDWGHGQGVLLMMRVTDDGGRRWA